MIKNGETVTFISNAQPNLFPSNTAYRFTNRLPHPWHIPYGEQWSVGMSEFSTVNTLNTVPKDLHETIRPFTDLVSYHEDKTYVIKDVKNSDNLVGLDMTQFEQMVEQFPNFHPQYHQVENTCAGEKNDDGKKITRFWILSVLSSSIREHSSYRPHLTILKPSKNVFKLKVKDNNTDQGRYQYMFSSVLQFLLALKHPIGTETELDIPRLIHRKIILGNGSKDACRFWYRIAAVSTQNPVIEWPGFDTKTGSNVKEIIRALSEKYSFFKFFERKEGKKTMIGLTFHET